MSLQYIVIFISIYFLTACSNVKKIDSIDKVEASSIIFYKRDKPIYKNIAFFRPAAATGILKHENNCLYFYSDKYSKEEPKVKTQYLVTWPWNYSLRKVNNKLFLIGDKQEKIVELGKTVTLTGGLSNKIGPTKKCRTKNSFWTFMVVRAKGSI